MKNILSKIMWFLHSTSNNNPVIGVMDLIKLEGHQYPLPRTKRGKFKRRNKGIV